MSKKKLKTKRREVKERKKERIKECTARSARIRERESRSGGRTTCETVEE